MSGPPFWKFPVDKYVKPGYEDPPKEEK